MSEELSEQQAEELVRGFAESKMTVPNFFNNVVKTLDSTKVGNVTQEELGMPKLPVRTYKELEVFCKDIACDDGWSEYFRKMAEIQLATGLSKDATLLKLVVTTKKELADVTPQKKANKGWFKSKDNSSGEQGAVQ